MGFTLRPPRRHSLSTATGSFQKQFRPLTQKRVDQIKAAIGSVVDRYEDVVPILPKGVNGVNAYELQDLLTNVPEPDIANIEKTIRVSCNYANDDDSSRKDSGLCVVVNYNFWASLRIGRDDELVEALKAEMVEPDNFFDFKYILILVPIIGGLENHLSLVAISPKNKTIDYLDSSPTPFRNSGDEAEIFPRVFNFLARYLGRRFVWPTWKIRRYASATQPTKNFECTAYVLANATCLAFGYSLIYDLYCNMLNRRQRAASELLNGGLGPYTGDSSDALEFANEFTYEFGNEDEKPTSQIGFHELEEDIVKTLPLAVQNNRGTYRDVTDIQGLLSVAALVHDDTHMKILRRWCEVPRRNLIDCVGMVELFDRRLLQGGQRDTEEDVLDVDLRGTPRALKSMFNIHRLKNVADLTLLSGTLSGPKGREPINKYSKTHLQLNYYHIKLLTLVSRKTRDFETCEGREEWNSKIDSEKEQLLRMKGSVVRIKSDWQAHV
ncbi:uncharacterized protein LY89DRAFT_760173 [Mollisia scopiformis]|uniref:Ubiquitin-like protease family profile domain-containing protein n=1 Tax=Mollisia scopiformis TaxID=149040 RepID=A0A132BD58_MOLSC|nr:uncharacterized protein LY89DRAFT_760173 [Mollisia scopiformis]KUJ10362.1 hypothetical protein LY89DRAFT_760173 [Mollisia scopiformis]